MKLYIFSAIIFIYASVQYTCGANPSNKVKVTGYETIYVNDQYFNKSSSKAEIIYVNETYNRLALQYEILQDIPSGIQFDVKIRRSKTETGKDWKEVAHYIINPCDKNDKYRKYLSESVISTTDSEHCFQKGSYASNDSGIFKYYDLLPPEDIEGYYFAAIMTFKFSEGKPLNLYVVRSQSIEAK